MSTAGRHLRAGHGPIPEDPKETRQGLHHFRQMLVDLRDAVQKEIDCGATKDQAVAAIKFPQYEQLQGTNLKEKSPRGARTGKSWARSSEINRLAHERLNWKECQKMSRPND